MQRASNAASDETATQVFSVAVAKCADEGMLTGSVDDNLTGAIDARRAVMLARKSGLNHDIDMSQVTSVPSRFWP